MPRLTKIRIVGNRYDNFKKHHENSIFNLTRDGEPDHTLFTLKNGSGKGVMMQLISQIVLPETRWGSNNGSKVTAMFYNRYKNFVPYTFHVMLEWKLDTTPERWLITGICMTANKRNIGKDEEEEEKVGVQYFLYTYEHNNNGVFTLENIPAYDKSRQRVVPYDEFERFISENRKYFRKYSKTAARRTNSDYYQYLKSNGIYRSEWEILKLINKAEGGMGEYFAKSGDNKAVFDNLIIPAISENMYNQSEEYRDALKEIFRSNLTITRKLPVLLAREEDYKNLLIMLEPLIEDAELGVRYQERLQRCIDDGNNLYQTFNNIFRSLESELKKSEQEKARALEEKRELAFQRDNLEYARKNKEMQLLEKQRMEWEREVRSLEEEIANLEEEEKRYELNKLIIPLERAIKEKENKLKLRETLTANLNIKELKEEMETLDREIEAEWENTSALWTGLTEKHTAYLNFLKSREQELKKSRAKLQEKINRIEVNIKAFEERLKDFKAKERELSGEFNPLQLQVPGVLLEELEGDYEKEEEKALELTEELTALSSKIEELKVSKLENDFKLKRLQEERDSLTGRYEERKGEEEVLFKKILLALNLDEFQEVYQEIWLKKKQGAVSDLIREKEERLTALQKELWENNIDLSLNDGDFWIASNDLLSLREKIIETGVKVEFGSKFLLSLPEEERSATLDSFPLLPYGLVILQEKDWEVIESNLAEDIFLHSGIPVFIRSEMNQVYQQNFRLVENKAEELTINREAFATWKRGLAVKSKKLLAAIESVRNNLDKLRELLSEIREILKKESSVSLNQQLQELQLDINKVEDKGKDLAGKIQKMEEELNRLEERRGKLAEKHKLTAERIKVIKDFIAFKDKIAAEREEITREKESLKEYQAREKEVQEELDILADKFKEEEIDFRTWKREVELKLKDIREVVQEAYLEEAAITSLEIESKPEYSEPGGDNLFLKLEKRRSLNARLEEKNNRIGIVNNEIKHLEKDITEYREELAKRDEGWESYRLEGVSLSTVEINLKNIRKRLVEKGDALRLATRKMERLKGKIETITDIIRDLFAEIKEKYNRSALLWDEYNLDEKEVKIRKASEENDRYLTTTEKIIAELQGKLFKMRTLLADIKGYKELDPEKGETNQRLLAKVKENPRKELEEWTKRFHEIERLLDNHQREARIHFEQFIQDLKTEVQEETLKTKIRESLDEGINIENYRNNLDSFISMREHFKKEINSLSHDKMKAEEAREQWANRASLQVIKIVESLKEMVGKMVYLNQNGYSFPLVRLRGVEHLPREEEDVKHLLKEYFLECIEEINKADLDINNLTDRELEKYMGDQAIFARAVRGRYPVLEVYKMTEKNEFLYARPHDYNYSTWEAINKGEGDDPEGSGGQTLSINTFVIMMLMNYRKKTIANENPWTVLMLDNPFGKASAEHVLDPIFEIADKLNFQIIAFAAPEIIKTEISERFPVFWALRIAGEDDEVKQGTVTGRVIHGGRVRLIKSNI